MKKMLYIVRGLPGSGKTTLAKAMGENLNIPHYEADMFMVDDKGDYKFSPERLKNAHDWCQRMTQTMLRDGLSVVVSNTFVKRWEIKIYADIAIHYGAEIHVMECQGDFDNKHGVPYSKIMEMKANWQEWE